MILCLDSREKGFAEDLKALNDIAEKNLEEVSSQVKKILDDVRALGDTKLVEYTNLYDRRSLEKAETLSLDKRALEDAYLDLEENVREALQCSLDRVKTYHEKQLIALGSGSDWSYEDENGNVLGQQVRGIERVGIYVPGGKAAYPSTVIMTAIPARVAGVKEIVLCVPSPEGLSNKAVLAAAHMCGVDRVFTIGGAQAIAALAFGTDSVPRVDKIVGPGSIYVAKAKELVFGKVGIDMIAGPSEVVIVADETVDPAWVVQDMFAQAEHDELAQAIVISANQGVLDRVHEMLPVMIREEKRKNIIKEAIQNRGALIKVRNLDEAFVVVNSISPEHLQLSIRNASSYVNRIRNVGAVFVGARSTEAVGDYTAGPSHVLPTNGSARFASPLGVYDFQTRTSVVKCSDEGSIELNRTASVLALVEGLHSHSSSASLRVEK
jgi:histidinol dehydrogenase